MKLVSVAAMREIERRATAEFRIKGEQLMDRAGSGVAFGLRRLAEVAGFQHAFVHLIAGRGNNGGDAFVAARYLKSMGFEVEVWLAGTAAQLAGDAAVHFGKLKSAKIRVEELPTLEDWQDALHLPLPAEIVVDGVLGTGLEGPARGPAAGAIQYIRSQANDAFVVSIDVPSGLDADTGRPLGETVMADLTLTMGLPKTGLLQPSAVDFIGALDVVDIGLPPEAVEDADAAAHEMVYISDLKRFFTRRPRHAHKGDFGHALLIGGAPGYAGAIALSALAAGRAGCGLVSVMTPFDVQPTVAGAALEAMVHGLPSVGGQIDAKVLPDILDACAHVDAVLIGPGLLPSPETAALVRALLADSPVPLIVDAGGLSALAGCAAEFKAARPPLVLTPHPGEMGALLGLKPAAVQSDRLGLAARAAALTGATVMLKGAGTVIALEGSVLQVNMTGNPGMATGGTGDVLAGIVVALLAQGFDPYDAARTAAYVHGRAGDLAAWRHCQTSLVARDLIDELPFAFRELSLR